MTDPFDRLSGTGDPVATPSWDSVVERARRSRARRVRRRAGLGVVVLVLLAGLGARARAEDRPDGEDVRAAGPTSTTEMRRSPVTTNQFDGLCGARPRWAADIGVDVETTVEGSVADLGGRVAIRSLVRNGTGDEIAISHQDALDAVPIDAEGRVLALPHSDGSLELRPTPEIAPGAAASFAGVVADRLCSGEVPDRREPVRIASLSVLERGEAREWVLGEPVEVPGDPDAEPDLGRRLDELCGFVGPRPGTTMVIDATAPIPAPAAGETLPVRIHNDHSGPMVVHGADQLVVSIVGPRGHNMAHPPLEPPEGSDLTLAPGEEVTLDGIVSERTCPGEPAADQVPTYVVPMAWVTTGGVTRAVEGERLPVTP